MVILASGIATAISIALAEPGQSIFIAQIARFGIAALSMSLAMNATATFLIASRIWWVTRRVVGQRISLSPSSDSPLPFTGSEAFAGVLVGGCLGIWKRHNRRYWRLVVILIESASSAAFIQVIGLASYAAKSPIIYFLADSTVQIVAIAPLLIIAFIGLTNDRSRGDWSTSLSYNDNGWRGVGESHGADYGNNAASRQIVGGIGSTSEEVTVEEGRCSASDGQSNVSTESEGGIDTNAGAGIADPMEMAMDSAPDVGASQKQRRVEMELETRPSNVCNLVN
ncbi:hypothetical protein APHAL10511_004088 [Amanita phalloides]|nr:hypothetical protein APHAL10511_004088 [Amanita phalloides]